MSERRRAKAVLEFHRAAKAALEAGEPLEGLRAHLDALEGHTGALPPETLAGLESPDATSRKPPRFDRPGAGE